MDWVQGRNVFRHLFDRYEGDDEDQWLGILEWAMLEEMRLRGPDLAADRTTQERIVARMADHPNIALAR